MDTTPVFTFSFALFNGTQMTDTGPLVINIYTHNFDVLNEASRSSLYIQIEQNVISCLD